MLEAYGCWKGFGKTFQDPLNLKPQTLDKPPSILNEPPTVSERVLMLAGGGPLMRFVHQDPPSALFHKPYTLDPKPKA